MAPENLGYIMCRIGLWWLVSQPLEVFKLISAWPEDYKALVQGFPSKDTWYSLYHIAYATKMIYFQMADSIPYLLE